MKTTGTQVALVGLLGAGMLVPVARASMLEQVEQELVAAVARLRPSVVAIAIHDRAWPGGPLHPKWASGVAIDPNGHIVSMGIPRPAPGGKLVVTDHRGKRWPAEFKGYDAQENLTLVKIDAGKVAPVKMAGDVLPTEGAFIIAVGNPYGFSGSVAYGNVSGLNRSIGVGGVQRAGLIQFTAPINPGDAGGCLANVRGEMIGVVASSLAGVPHVWRDDKHKSRAQIYYWGARPHAMGFAVPTARVRQVVRALTTGQRVQRGYLGVYGRPNPAGDGALVDRLIPGAPAEAAGLHAGDVIIAVGPRTIRTFEDLRAAVEATKPGEKVNVVVRRNGKTHGINVTMGEKPVAKADVPPGKPSVHPGPYGDWRDLLPKHVPGEVDKWIPPGARPFVYGQPGQKPLLGVRCQELTDDLRTRLGIPAGKGVLIAEILPNSPAANVELKPMDVLLRVGDTEVNTPDELAGTLRKIGADKRVRLTLKRDKTDLVVVVRLAKTDWPKPWSKTWRRWLPPGVLGDPEAYRRRVEQLEKRVKELQEQLKKARQRQMKPVPNPRPATQPTVVPAT